MDLKELQEQNREHWNDVYDLMHDSASDLKSRAASHDNTKFETIGEHVLLKALNTRDFSNWEKYHFSKEDHHPEYWGNKTDMPLEAILEMCADGASAAYRRSPKRQTFDDQYDFFVERKGWSHEMATILANQFIKYYKALEEKYGKK